MTKDQLQQELKKEIRPGVKPSDLKKKLKRSKSADDIPSSSTPNIPLKKYQSQLEIPLIQPNSKEQITNLKEQVKFHAETAQNYLQSLSTSQAKVSELETQIKNNPPNPLLQEQLKVKQQEIESLRKKLENTNTKLTETTQELDNSLFARYEAVKQFGKVYDKLQLVKQELDDTVDQASDELISSDDKASSLRTKLFTARQQISDLQKDLKLAQRLAELRKYPLPDNSPNLDYLSIGFYALGTIILIS
jgi:chromosome segregation ATPase